MKKINVIIMVWMLIMVVGISYAQEKQSELFGRIEIDGRLVKTVKVKEIQVFEKVFKRTTKKQWKWEFKEVARTTVNRYNRYFLSLPPGNYEFQVSLIRTPENKETIIVKNEVIVASEPTEKNWIIKISEEIEQELPKISLEEE